MATQGTHRPEAIVAPSPVVNALINDHMVLCLIFTGLEVTIMVYKFLLPAVRDDRPVGPVLAVPEVSH